MCIPYMYISFGNCNYSPCVCRVTALRRRGGSETNIDNIPRAMPWLVQERKKNEKEREGKEKEL
jgi:hypothetical protein